MPAVSPDGIAPLPVARRWRAASASSRPAPSL